MKLHLIFLLAALLLTTCTTFQATPPSPTPPIPPLSPTPFATASPSPLPPTPLPSPSSTPSPTPTVIPTPTAITASLVSLSQENISKIAEIYRWGRGQIKIIRFLKDGKALVLTPINLYLYQTSPLTLVKEWPGVKNFALTPDQSKIALVNQDGIVEIEDLDSGNSIQKIEYALPENLLDRMAKNEIAKNHVGGLAFSPTGQEIAIGYVDGTIQIYKIGESTPYLTIAKNAYLDFARDDYYRAYRIVYSSDGKTLGVYKVPWLTATTLALFDLSKGAQLKAISTPTFGRALLAEDDLFLFIEARESLIYVQVWDAQTGTMRKMLNTGLAYLRNDLLKLENGIVEIYGQDVQGQKYHQQWEALSGKQLLREKIAEFPKDEAETLSEQLFTFEHYETLWPTSATTWDHSRIEVLNDNSFLINVRQGWLTFPEQELQPFAHFPERPVPVYYDLRSRTLAWCVDSKAYWVVQEQLYTQDLPLADCKQAVISPNYRYLVTKETREVVIIDLETGKFTNIKNPKWWLDIYFSPFSPSGTLFVSLLGRLREFSVENEVRIISEQQNEYVNAYALSNFVFSKDGSFFLATRGLDPYQDEYLGLFDSPYPLLLWRKSPLVAEKILTSTVFKGINKPGRFLSYTFSNNTTMIATGDDHGVVTIRRLPDTEILAKLEFDYLPVALAFANDDKGIFIALSDGTIRLFGVKSEQ